MSVSDDDAETIAKIFVFRSTRLRHIDAPLLRERALFLHHLHERGGSKIGLRTTAAMLLNVIRIMSLDEMRPVWRGEINDAAKRWVYKNHSTRTRWSAVATHRAFQSIATRWYKFHGFLTQRPNLHPDIAVVEAFQMYLMNERKLAQPTITSYIHRTNQFLQWLKVQDVDLPQLSPKHVDAYLEYCVLYGYRPHTIAGTCSSLRSFFEFGGHLGVWFPLLSQSIVSPRVRQDEHCRVGPEWADVRRMLRDSSHGESAFELRACAVLTLSSIYALRSRELTGLLLTDINWKDETIYIRRAKHGRLQRFPLCTEVKNAISRYLNKVRPECDSQSLLLTLVPPHRAIRQATCWTIVSQTMKKLGIVAPQRGIHALRHACATQLLRMGESLHDIADFLGHRDTKSVSIYARHDPMLLTQVADFDLSEVL